jgi:hypothetical protein
LIRDGSPPDPLTNIQAGKSGGRPGARAWSFDTSWRKSGIQKSEREGEERKDQVALLALMADDWERKSRNPRPPERRERGKRQ